MIIWVPFKSLCIYILFCISLLWLTIYMEHVVGMKMFIFFPCVYVSRGVTERKLCERKGSMELEKKQPQDNELSLSLCV